MLHQSRYALGKIFYGRVKPEGRKTSKRTPRPCFCGFPFNIHAASRRPTPPNQRRAIFPSRQV